MRFSRRAWGRLRSECNQRDSSQSTWRLVLGVCVAFDNAAAMFYRVKLTQCMTTQKFARGSEEGTSSEGSVVYDTYISVACQRSTTVLMSAEIHGRKSS